VPEIKRLGKRRPDGRQELGREPRLEDIAEPARVKCGPGEVGIFADLRETHERRITEWSG
jgi:hypothetical protein